MHFVDRHREKIRQSPMSSRLLWACLLLVVLLVLTFGAALFLFASLHNTKKDISRSLQIQFSVFQNDMERYFDQLAVMGVNLSEDMSAEVDKELALRQISFAQLNDSPEVLNALEEEMIEPLCRCLRQTGCSGAFVLLDATVNTRMEGAEHSRAGLYVQKSGADTPTVPLLLYRGSADVGKTHSVIPHRKWRMEFQTDQFPDYDRWMTPSSTPLYQAYTLTERFSLPGTSEEVQLFLLPLRGRDGTMYGLCGFEISQSFFKQNFAQPTGFDHLICLLAPADSGLNASAALSSGTTGGYFHAPREMLVLRSMGSSLTQLIGSDSAYAGISELCRLSENQSYRLAVCIPMTDYRRLIFSGNLQMLSAFVEMLEGKRRLRECYLDDYVKNVRAKAKMSLEKPEGATLSRILSIDSDPALSQAEGVYVQFFEDWEEGVLRGQEQVCLISSDMVTDGEYITVAADMGESARLRIIGTVANGPSNEIYCPYFMSWSEGVSVAFLTDSCSFDIRNNQKLEESKSYIYEWFVRPDLSNQMDGLTFGVLIHDETYQKNIEEIQANLSMLHLLLPVLIIVCGGIGFFASFLATRGRTKEFAVMRCLGMKQCKIFGLVMGELSILAFTGAFFGIAGGILLEGEIQTSALLHAALMTGIFLLGSAAAALRITSINVMNLMKVED